MGMLLGLPQLGVEQEQAQVREQAGKIAALERNRLQQTAEALLLTAKIVALGTERERQRSRITALEMQSARIADLEEQAARMDRLLSRLDKQLH
jgi:hypothetical protein